MYTEPELLVFDEATSDLDRETEAAVIESIRHLHGEKTIVIIAHRLEKGYLLMIDKVVV